MISFASGLDVLAVGELNPDFILAGIRVRAPELGTEQEFDRYRLTLGSSTAITCVLLQRLGLRTAMAACVGDDEHGRFCRDALRAEGVDTSLVETRSGVATGLTICLPYPDDRLLLTCKGAMTLDPSTAVTAAVLRGVRHLHVGSFFLQSGLRPRLPQLFAHARALGVTTSLDTGWDSDGHWLTDDLQETLAHTSIVFPNEQEFEQLSGGTDVARGIARLRNLGVGTVVLKRGPAGAVHGDADGLVAAAGYGATAIDTTGAGDSFNAGYLAAMLTGAAVAERLSFSNACGALTVAAIGGTGGVTDAAQVRAFLSAGGGADR